jgi:hypothetical protein
MREILPARITEQIRELCRKLSGGGEPTFVPVRPQADSVVKECYLNVNRAVERDQAGRIVYGWLVWIEARGFYLNCVHHAVYLNSHDELIDPTPTEDGETQILFVPDPSRQYEGFMISPRIIPLVEDRKVWAFADAAMNWWDWHEKNTHSKVEIVKTDEYFRLMARYELTKMALEGVAPPRPKAPVPIPRGVVEQTFQPPQPPYRKPTPKERAETRKKKRRAR